MTLETFRLVSTLVGTLAFALLCYRLVGRFDKMSDLSRIVVSLLALSVLVFGLGAARAASLQAPLNEFSFVGFGIELVVILVCWRWPHLLDPTRKRT